MRLYKLAYMPLHERTPSLGKEVEEERRSYEGQSTFILQKRTLYFFKCWIGLNLDEIEHLVNFFPTQMKGIQTEDQSSCTQNKSNYHIYIDIYI